MRNIQRPTQLPVGLGDYANAQIETKISLFTVPHTGTHFAIEFLKLLGIEHKAGTGFFHIHAPQKRITDWSNGGWHTISHTKCVVTARDPILTAIRYIHNNNYVSNVAKHWDTFLNALEHLNSYAVLNIGCAKDQRFDHLCDIAEFVGKDPAAYENIIAIYADAWEPRNISDNEIKQEYLDSGGLPTRQILQNKEKTWYEDIDWDALNPAIEWYNNFSANTES